MAKRNQGSVAGIALGSGLVILGLVAVVWPSVGAVPHFGMAGEGVSSTRAVMEPTTRTASRVAGAAAILLGAALLKFSQPPR